MKWISLVVFMTLFSCSVFAAPHYVSVYNIGKVSLLPQKEVEIDYSLRNKYDVLYHISENYNSIENCGVRFLKSGFANSEMEFYGRECIEIKPVVKKNRIFDVQLIYENNELNVFT